jgi:hypothetical protein
MRDWCHLLSPCPHRRKHADGRAHQLSDVPGGRRPSVRGPLRGQLQRLRLLALPEELQLFRRLDLEEWCVRSIGEQ